MLCSLSAMGQMPQKFHKVLPPGNYSGITALGDNRYAIVSDKSEEDGFFVLKIVIDSIKGRITSFENEGFRSSGLPNRDMEGICYRPSTNTVFISGEKDNEVYEYTLDGQRTGQRLEMPEGLKNADHNIGLESLTYDPISEKHYHGVSELCALNDGRLLVLERQIRVPRLKIGASTTIRIYEVFPSDDPFLEKKLLTEFRTRVNLIKRKFANYEGLCQPAPNLLLLIADSQNRYKGFLRDWFLVLKME